MPVIIIQCFKMVRRGREGEESGEERVCKGDGGKEEREKEQERGHEKGMETTKGKGQ